MSSELVFMMGEFEARFPTDRQYTTNHMWAQQQGGSYRFGFSAYAIRLLQDVYFLDWSVDAQTKVAERQLIGSIESSKAESDLFSPLEGRLTCFNEALLSDPALINVDGYERGWLFEISGQGDAFHAPQEYIEYLVEVWEVAQRTIKGQLH
ncbi:MAG: glycine cleavage system protein H [Planctomycetaceae bacterium]|nr:glycine cleavage system protein H [Planctomycetaceae bacterium]MBP60944.1 glycine cleavage system protein H [Planctomycetaceae bacterium]